MEKLIVTIGEILVEIMASEPGEGFRAPLALVGPYPSGAPAIFISQAARLGQPCGIVGCVGRDDFGRLNIDRLRADGVDVSAIAVDPEVATGSAFVRYRPDGGRDFVFNIKHSASGRLRPGAAARALLRQCDHLHVMGSSLFSDALVAATLEAIAGVKDRGGTVSFDPNVRKEMLDLPGMREALAAILARCDLFLPSGPELHLFADAPGEADAAAEILGRGVGCVVVKHGAAGAVCYAAGAVLHQPAFAVQEVDPTGAGDCFGATFVTCWLRGMELRRALAYAAASGAAAVLGRGPMEGTATFGALDRLIAGTPQAPPGVTGAPSVR